MVDLGFTVLGVPEVVPVHVPVAKPERAVVGMITLFARDTFFHGEVSGQGLARRSNEGVKVGNLAVGQVFGDEGIIMVDPEGGFRFFLSESCIAGESQAEKDGDGFHGLSRVLCGK